MKQIKVLVVDDFAMVRAMVKHCLTDIGVTSVQEASDGEDAFNKITAAKKENVPFDLVFIDWNMPKMTGIEVIKKVRLEEGAGVQTPFIMITAEREKKEVVEAFLAGAFDYVVKPFSAETLKEKILSALEKKNLSS